MFDEGSTTDIHTCTVLGNTLTEGGGEGGGKGGFGPSVTRGRDIINKVSNKKKGKEKAQAEDNIRCMKCRNTGS